MTLAAPIFLIGLVAIGIPIAIHLLQLRRYKKVYFSNVDALMELQDENRRQHRLRQWLVLAMRILAIIFVVLAFCRPTIVRKGASAVTGQTAVSVYLDNSYSMECGGMDGSLMESAKTKAREIAAAYRPDDRFQLLTGDAEGSQFRWLSRDEFLAEVDHVQTSAATPMMAAVASRQQDFLRSAQARNRHAYIVSDFQRSTANLADFPTDSSVLTTFIPLGGSGVDNLYLDTLVFNSPAYSRGNTVVAEVTVCNNGSRAVEGIPLRLFVNGRQRALASVDIAAGGRSTVPLRFTIDEEGTLQGYVETVDYPVTFDDRLFFTLNVAGQVPMTVVLGHGENEYLNQLFKGDSLIAYHAVQATNIDYTHLTDSPFIILDQLSNIPSGLAQTLIQFVNDGGTLTVIPDEQASLESYNLLLGALRAPLLGSWRKGRATVQEIDIENSLYYGVFDGKAENMELPTVQGSFLLQSDASTLREEVMTLADGTPLLTVTPAGDGRVYLFGCPLRKEYTDLVQQALFVPTLYNMALYSTPRQQPYHLAGSTDPIPLLGHYDGEQIPHLVSVDSINSQPGHRVTIDIIPDLRRIGRRHCLIPHGEVRQAGNYRLADGRRSSGANHSTIEGISLNYGRAESDLSVYSTSDLRQLLRDDNLAYCSLMPNASKSVTEHIRQQREGTPLWRWCLLLTLLALAAETLLLRMKVKSKN